MNAQRQSFHERGLADSRFADQNRVVLAPPGKNVHHLADFIVAATDRVDSALTGAGGDVEGEPVQRILQRRVQLSFYIRIHRTADKLHLIPLRKLRFLLHLRAFIRLRIQKSTQALKLALRQRQQRPQAVAAQQFRFFHQSHQEVNAADVLFPRQRGVQPGVLHKGLHALRKLRTAAH